MYRQSIQIFQLEVLAFSCSNALPHLRFVKTHWVLWVSFYFFPFIKSDKFYDTFLSPFQFTITKTFKKPHNTTDSQRSDRNEKKGREADGGDVSCCTSRPVQAVIVHHPFDATTKYRQRTEHTRNVTA
jgi:hypothetical protein